MMYRSQKNSVLKLGRLFLKYFVDIYVKIDSEKLRYIRNNQRQLKVESYSVVWDDLNRDSRLNIGDVGRNVILSSSYIDRARYRPEKRQDCFAKVRKF